MCSARNARVNASLARVAERQRGASMIMRHCYRSIIAAALMLQIGTVSAAGVDNRPEWLITGGQRLPDVDLPAEAKRGSGIASDLNPAALGAPGLLIPLADGRVLHATRQRVVQDASHGWQSWIGKFEDQPGSLAVLSRARGVTTGFITYGAETFEVMPSKGGRHMLYSVDQTLLAHDDEVLTPETTGTSDASSSTPDGNFVHDLLVVYTPSSSARYGQAALESKIVAAVAAANQAYLNSNVHITLNLVGLQEIDYVDGPSLSQSLSYLRGTTDGQMDSVHVLRDVLGADLVALVSEDLGCGVSYLMAPESAAFASSAFSAVYSECLSQHSLAHELGHLQGNMHDRESSTIDGAFPYSHGLRRCVSDGTGFRTVMSYNCPGAPRVTQFSNPDVYYNGWPTGISYELDPANSADNARSMNQTADTVAAFRSVSTSAPQAPSSLSASALSADSDRLTWADNSSDEVGFTIERSGNGIEFTDIATLGSGTTSFIDTGLSARTTYWYRVHAFNGAGYSEFSSTATVTTPDAAPAAPVEVAALNNGDGSASVSWIDASSNETGFEARRETWDSKRGIWKNLTIVGTAPAGITALVDLTGNGTFRYTVRALGSGTTSEFAGPAQVNVTGGAKNVGKGRGQ
jgi:hypothetical protein